MLRSSCLPSIISTEIRSQSQYPLFSFDAG
jgi:hypothetical protein